VVLKLRKEVEEGEVEFVVGRKEMRASCSQEECGMSVSS
jgi:hypothetical protein